MIAFIGAGDISVETAKDLINNGHSVVMIEIDKARIEYLLEEMDCSFLHGDGTRPDILRELNPSNTEVLFCLTNNDQDNILASLVADSLGFKHIVTSIADAEFESVCRELGIKNTIIPVRTISRYLQDIVNGSENVEISPVLKDDARFFTFIMGNDSLEAQDLNLPNESKVICYYREGQFYMATESTLLQQDDEVVILTHSKNIAKLRSMFVKKVATSL